MGPRSSPAPPGPSTSRWRGSSCCTEPSDTPVAIHHPGRVSPVGAIFVAPGLLPPNGDTTLLATRRAYRLPLAARQPAHATPHAAVAPSQPGGREPFAAVTRFRAVERVVLQRSRGTVLRGGIPPDHEIVTALLFLYLMTPN